jgi:transposase
MSIGKRRVFDPEFKLWAVERLMGGEPIDALSAELGVSKLHLYKWRLHFCRGGPGALRRAGRPRGVALASGADAAGAGEAEALLAARRRIAELEGKIGRQQLELDFFRQALRQVGSARGPSDGPGVPASTRSSRR